jgi:hypothetical protein
MSKVYSFRLNVDNPREVQAKEVIDTWVSQGYSLRYIVVDALISYNKVDLEHNELSSIMDQLREMILSLDKISEDQPSDSVLPNSFLMAVKNSAKLGITYNR